MVIDKFKPAGAVKICPRCHELSLEFDSKEGKIHCTRCGFEEYIQRME